MTQNSIDTSSQRSPVTANGRSYNWPKRPTVVICFDGCDPTYLEAASAAGVIPTFDKLRREGIWTTALAAMPTFTNPNNVSIVCGAPPAVHGVSGNFYIDRETGHEIMMVDATPMRAPTLLAAFSEAGASVVAITAKDKLRKALGKDLKGIAFSAEKADSVTLSENGIDDIVNLVGRPAPDQYSADLSLFVLDAGIKLLQARKPDLLYLSLSDYVQHKHAPNETEALEFMAAVDARVAALLELGAVVGIVADHGMTDLAREDGAPNVIYIGDVMDEVFGDNASRVICPITDPFVRHHGALGGFVRVHLAQPAKDLTKVLEFLRVLPGVALALSREEACKQFDLPADREGDIAVIGARGVALGGRAVDHDISQLAGQRLRSHGSLDEQVVPFIISHPLRASEQLSDPQTLRNFDIFAVALNATEV